jgi:nitroreductase
MERKSEYAVNPLILSRWSPRAMSGEVITDDDLMAMMEAAKWAPSCFNSQPWRFIYAKRESKNFAVFLDILFEGNREWAKNASALVLVISTEISDYNGKPLPTHGFDSGAACENLALEAVSRDFHAHAMFGFDQEKAKRLLGIPDGYSMWAMVAIGKRGDKTKLSPVLQEREVPSDRKALKEIIMEGSFKKLN